MMRVTSMSMLRQSAAPVATQTQAAPPEQGAAFVPRAGGPPDTSRYLTAGYIVAFAIYAGYIVLLLRRMAQTRRT